MTSRREQSLIGDILWREFLGRGLQLLITLMIRQFGMAVLVTDKNSNDLVVVKAMLKTELKKEHQTAEGKSLTTMAENEEYTMRLAQSDFVVSFYDSFRYKQFSCVLCE